MLVQTFAEIRETFLARVQRFVYCNMSTVDARNRPRSRIMHPVWDVDVPVGYVISWPESLKFRHLAQNPHVSLAYFGTDGEPPGTEVPVYVECTASWMTDRAEQWRVWELYKTVPPPMGFDPTPHYGDIDHPYFGLLKLIPWRIALCTLRAESIIWQPG